HPEKTDRFAATATTYRAKAATLLPAWCPAPVSDPLVAGPGGYESLPVPRKRDSGERCGPRPAPTAAHRPPPDRKPENVAGARGAPSARPGPPRRPPEKSVL